MVVLFITSWLLLLTRFGQLEFHKQPEEVEEPNKSYVNNIGIVTAMLWLVPGCLFFAIVSGRVEHQDVHNVLWMTYHMILLLVCILGGSDLQGAITNVTTFDAVHIDVAFVFTSTMSYALLPQTTHVVVHSHPESREPLMENGGQHPLGVDPLPTEGQFTEAEQAL